MNPNRLPRDEEAAALSIKLIKLLIQQIETDSDPDHWRVLKYRVAELDRLSDAILGWKSWMILDDCAYLIPGSGRLSLKVAPNL
jgi:hypothetical protein